MAWNVFRFCTALKGLGSIMILLVLSIVGVTYYAVVLCNYGPALLAGGATTLAALAVLLLFHFLVRVLVSDANDLFLGGNGKLQWARMLLDVNFGSLGINVWYMMRADY